MSKAADEQMENRIGHWAEDKRVGDAVAAVMHLSGVKMIIAGQNLEMVKLQGKLQKDDSDHPNYDPDRDMKIKNGTVKMIVGANLVRTVPEKLIEKGRKADVEFQKLGDIKEKRQGGEE